MALLALGTACGDPGAVQVVLLHNATDITVVVYANEDILTPPPTIVLQPGDTKKTGWFVGYYQNHRQKRTVKAYDQSGNLIFCKTYTVTYEEARNKDVTTVEITRGDLSCLQE